MVDSTRMTIENDMLSVAVVLTILVLITIRYLNKRRRMQLMMARAEAEKYGLNSRIEMVDGQVRLLTFSRQVETLNGKEYDAWKVRDNAREKNYDQFELSKKWPQIEAETTDEEFTEKRDDQRTTWNATLGNKMKKHLKFAQKEIFGSGVTRLDISDEEKLDLVNRSEREGVVSGPVQITLTWDDYNDLDLYIYTPSKEEISFRKRRSQCGGRLDIDMNKKPLSNAPIENVVWAKSPPEGMYKVFVHFHRHHDRDDTQATTTYKLRVRVWDEEKHYSGMITFGSALEHVVSFSVEEGGKE
jgi:competence protein ComGC